jgi:AbrB family looped-hinge helix DNA binding protein
MNTRVRMDKAGRIVIPKPVREELRLEPGDPLEIETTGEQIILHPVRESGPLFKEHGVWVLRTGQPLPATATDEVVQQIRRERGLIE